MRYRVLVTMLAAVLALAAAAADGVAVARHANAAPEEISAAVRAVLAPGGATVKVADTAIEFWWVRSLDATGGGWGGVAEGALVGAMRTSATFRDIRGRTIKPGTYLLRFAMQPQNGDHLGVSPYREFLVATPAADDQTAAPVGHDAAVELGAKTTNIAHPAVLSVDPPVTADAPLTVTQNEAGHTAVVFEVPTSGGPLKFGLIVVGRIEA